MDKMYTILSLVVLMCISGFGGSVLATPFDPPVSWGVSVVWGVMVGVVWLFWYYGRREAVSRPHNT